MWVEILITSGFSGDEQNIGTFITSFYVDMGFDFLYVNGHHRDIYLTSLNTAKFPANVVTLLSDFLVVRAHTP